MMFAACSASPPSGLDSSAGLAPAARLARLNDADRRVAEVAFRLSVANRELCSRTGPLAGWALHAADQYGPELRPAAVASFGLDGALPGVLAVAPGGPAAQAGMKAGDLIVSVDGRPLGPGRGEAVPTFEDLEANIRILDAALGRGVVELGVRGSGGERTIRFRGVDGCAYGAQVEPGEDLNARANGRMVFITAGMVHFAASDPDLALILGHEMAHNILGHRDAEGRLTVPAWRASEAERAADRTGLYLLARAGYPIDGAPGFWRRFGAANWRARYAQLGHPSAESRARALGAVRDEILARRAAGLPLTP